MRASLEIHSPLSFASRRPSSRLIDPIRRTARRWSGRARLEAIAVVLCDIKFNPFQFQIDRHR